MNDAVISEGYFVSGSRPLRNGLTGKVCDGTVMDV